MIRARGLQPPLDLVIEAGTIPDENRGDDGRGLRAGGRDVARGGVADATPQRRRQFSPPRGALDIGRARRS